MQTRSARFPFNFRWLAMFAVIGGFSLLARGEGANPKPALVAHFKVRDAKTLEPVQGLRIVPAARYNNEHAPVTWQSQYLKRYATSPADYSMQRGFDKTVLRVDAEGYLPFITRTIKRGEAELTFDILLEPDPGMAGKVLEPDGAPAAGASLAVCTWTNEVSVSSGTVRLGSHGEELSQIYETAADGTFRIPREIDPFVLVLVHDTGYCEVTAGDFNASSTITLKPWGRVEGECIVDGKPLANVEIAASSSRGDVDVVLHRNQDDTTDVAGKFVFERVPPVSLYAAPRFKFGEMTFGFLWFSGEIEIAPGAMTHVSLPRAGRPIEGRIAVSPASGLELADLALELSVALRPPGISGPQDLVQKSLQAYRVFMESDLGKAFHRDKIAVNADGGFRIDGLPETIYLLNIRAYRKTDPPSRERRNPVAHYSARVTVPPADEAGTPLDLGELVLKP